MKKLLFLLILLPLIAGCAYSGSSDTEETTQQESGTLSIIQNQPLPNLGGYSFEREIVKQTYIARNNAVNTYAYSITYDGKIIEICPSMGYPIPYSTQLTAPEKIGYSYGSVYVIPQSEPNSLYPPGDAAATLIQCVNPDGSVSPVYWEWYVNAFPYRIKADIVIERLEGASSFSVDVNK